jgi:7-cyano-7-deazaguanine synthase
MLHVVIYSGGLDSLVLLNKVKQEISEQQAHRTAYSGVWGEERLMAVTFDYGQRHTKELRKAVQVGEAMGIEHRLIELPMLRMLSPNAANPDKRGIVPWGADGLPPQATMVVPGRNTIMLSIAMGIAEAALQTTHKACDNAVIYLGVNRGGHASYPDCRPDYIRAMSHAFWQATERRVTLDAPFLHMTKGAIVLLGQQLGVDFAQSWSCYQNGPEPCGECIPCTERAKAFAALSIPDPLLQKVDAG